MDVIGLDRKLHHRPAVLLTLRVDQPCEFDCNGTDQHTLAPLWTPDQMVDHEVDTVFVALIVYVGSIPYNNLYIYATGLKPV